MLTTMVETLRVVPAAMQQHMFHTLIVRIYETSNHESNFAPLHVSSFCFVEEHSGWYLHQCEVEWTHSKAEDLAGAEHHISHQATAKNNRNPGNLICNAHSTCHARYLRSCSLQLRV